MQPSSTSSSTDEPPLVFIDLELVPGSPDRVALYRGSDLTAIAASIAARHHLADDMRRRLLQLLTSELDDALARTRAPVLA
jgi:hypothetical protein